MNKIQRNPQSLCRAELTVTVKGCGPVVFSRNEIRFYFNQIANPNVSIYKRIIRKQEAQTVVHISSDLEKKLYRYTVLRHSIMSVNLKPTKRYSYFVTVRDFKTFVAESDKVGSPRCVAAAAILVVINVVVVATISNPYLSKGGYLFSSVSIFGSS